MTASRAVHSNAFNFLGHLQHSVDTRTGQYTVTIDLPELKSNHLCGPAVPLQLEFNPMNVSDSGFGMGWNLNLSQYTPYNQMLALSSGENFKVTGSGAQPAIKEKKLDTFHFYDEGNDTYRVVHKSGLVEILQTGGSSTDRVALPRQILAPSGHSVSLTYVIFNGGQLLETVSDAYGTLLRVERAPSGDFVKIHLHPDKGPDGKPLATFEMTISGEGTVSQIVLPTKERASWRFQYQKVFGKTCLKEVQTPGGSLELIEHTDAGHIYPGPVREALPRVTRHLTYPGFGQPMIEVTYTYTSHNFLGYGLPINWADDGLDNLYKAQAGYEYGSTSTLNVGGAPVRTVARTFNRFHLQTGEITTQGDCVTSTTTEYHELDVPFDQQPPHFQMPRESTTSWMLTSDPTRFRTLVERTAFDEYGNLTEQVQPNGIRETFTYYAKEGEEGCPADPHGFVRQQKEKHIWPAPGNNGNAPVLRLRYRYKLLPALTAASAEDWLVMYEETLTSSDDGHEAPLHVVEITYNNQPADPSIHGRHASNSQTRRNHIQLTTFDYSTPFSTLAGETVGRIQETVTGFDGCQRVMTREQSLVGGYPVVIEDIDGAQVKMEHDALGRVVRQIVAPGSPYEAIETYVYNLTTGHGQQSSQELTSIAGVKTRTTFDGINRVILEEREDKDAGDVWRKTYEASYDARGDLTQTTEYDWLDDQNLALTRFRTYDDWGEPCRVTDLDGVSIVTETSPFGLNGPVRKVWQEIASDPEDPDAPVIKSGISITELNAFEMPDSIVRMDDTGKTVGSLHYLYDGKGNCVEQKQALNDRTLVTTYVYDAIGRMTETHLPDLTQVKRTFAEHSDEELPVTLLVTPDNTAQPAVTLGTQKFDGLERLSELAVGPRVETYQYQGGSPQVSQRVTPSKKVFDYTYITELTPQPHTIQLMGKPRIEYTYDSQTSRITGAGKSATDLENQYSYDNFGHLRQEVRRDPAGTSRETNYRMSLQGRHLRSDITDGLPTEYAYDAFGRAESLQQGKLSTTFTYNQWSRLQQKTTRHTDTGRSLTTDLEYDSLGRETKRTLTVSGEAPRTFIQTWYNDDKPHTRDREVNGQSLCKETFVYDVRGRLEHYTCAGTELPTDSLGNRLSDQVFRYDALDNITHCVSQYEDGSRDVARFTYASADPCQLVNVTHSHSSYPASIDFSYDADGHLLNDENGNRLSYTEQGRLLEVRAAANDELIMACRYDGHEELAAVRNGTESETSRFYQGNRLSCTLQDQTMVQCLLDDVAPLGQQQSGDDTKTLLLMTDFGESVIGEHQATGQTRTRAYSPYGEQVDDLLLSLLANNGELREAPGWYLLGRGYRAYNPALMRFHSPDSLSPFGEGGLNPYMYCHGNPISFRDPTGHRIDDQGRPGGNPGYQDPPEEPEKPKKWLQWLGVASTIAIIGVTAFFIPWSTTISVPMLLGMGALAVQSAGAVYQIIGVATENPQHSELGGTITGIGVALAGIAGVAGFRRKQQKAKQEQKEVDNFYTYNDRERFSFNNGKRPSLTESAEGRINRVIRRERLMARILRLKFTGPDATNATNNAGTGVSTPRSPSLESLASEGIAGPLVKPVLRYHQTFDVVPSTGL